VGDQRVSVDVEADVRKEFGAGRRVHVVHENLMLRRTLGDERETPTRSLCPVAVEKFAAVGRLTALCDVVIEDT